MLYSITIRFFLALLSIGLASTSLLAQNKVYKFDRTKEIADTVEVEELDLTSESFGTINLEVDKEEEKEETVDAKKKKKKNVFYDLRSEEHTSELQSRPH